MINLQNNTNNNEKDITIVCWFPGFKGDQFIRKLTNNKVISISHCSLKGDKIMTMVVSGA